MTPTEQAVIDAAGGWRTDMENAPLDRPIQARIPGEVSDFVIQWYAGLLDGRDSDCGGWLIVEDQEPPRGWTDGICWAVNEDGKPSTQPDAWKELPKGETA